jgi:hypothetical protein
MLNKDELEALICTLPSPLLAKVDEGLRWFLRLEG